MSAADGKAALRRACLARRDALLPAVRAAAAQAIAANALLLPHLGQAALEGPVAGYWPIRSEVDPRPLMVALASRGAALCLPVVAAPTLRFRAYGAGDPLHDAGFGTRGPSPEALDVSPRILLVPCLAFDRRGGRLGYGAGHYDRALARLAAEGPVVAIALAFATQEVEQVPTEAHDRPLDAIVTEREWVSPPARPV
ncbi:5-formyltetrahydrofolate cyclo-ligase [Chelatococcus reniformis]|uniref:5-formyltetrahydrofolate cyclo-ligase n=1 Tax=Chelatococcus reniformis TaxID=1494448 RepID=A0A916U8Q3_9HYPH|nr:5-formyltetrahydrofolate cyclo-ligase [Chelatococcus reniformis]GGC64406.1 hypothetical protein GCM10010994_23770 [Chelatococcus reniformis]